MLVHAGDPPLPPGHHDGQALLLPELLQPPEGAGDGHIGVHVARVDPDPELLLHHDRVQPVAGIGEHDVVLLHSGTALLEVDGVDVQPLEHQGLVEEVHDPHRVIAAALVDLHIRVLSALPQLLGLVGALVIAWAVDVQDAGPALLELLVQHRPQRLAVITMVAQDAASPHMVVIFLSHVGMPVQEFVLVDGHAIARGVALVGVRAAIADQHSLQPDDGILGRGELVVFEDLVCQVRNVDPCVALS